ncbi:MAG: hypothetical protein E6K69_06550 [Nitrospirae bacterium]|nr:MAG: hypothetical protein E6K69_06550 [Nitrospirota bacterium]
MISSNCVEKAGSPEWSSSTSDAETGATVNKRETLMTSLPNASQPLSSQSGSGLLKGTSFFPALVLLACAGQVFPPPALTGIAEIEAGWHHTCAVTTAGDAKCWGNNHDGQLGDGTEADRLTPVDVVGLLSKARAISAGERHTCALTRDGGAKCWGNNHDSQLGDGTDVDKKTPVDVVGVTSGVQAIVAGWRHTCALTTLGGVKCWGNNHDGQLGDGTKVDKNVPVDVMGLVGGVKAITAGRRHTCALTTLGGVKCWGNNHDGQLGDGTKVDKNIPVDVIGLVGGVKAIAAGWRHTCALTTAGSVKCWGKNHDGQLGDGTAINRSSPVDVVGLPSVVHAIAAGGQHTCGLNPQFVSCWGDNEDGQLGDGTTADTLAAREEVGL